MATYIVDRWLYVLISIIYICDTNHINNIYVLYSHIFKACMLMIYDGLYFPQIMINS